MKRIIASLVLGLWWAGTGFCQQLPVRFGANGQPLTPFQTSTYFNLNATVDRTYPRDSLFCAQQIGFTTEKNSLATNTPMNGSQVNQQQLQLFIGNPEPDAGGNPTLPSADYKDIVANYNAIISPIPSTDMLIRWTACRWGLDEDTMKAQFWVESSWHEDTAGDKGNSPTTCSSTPFALSQNIYDANVDWANNTRRRVQSGCFQSYGIGQEKVIFLPTTFPLVKDNTAFAVDYRGAATRGCLNGDQETWFKNAVPPKCTATAGSHGNCDQPVSVDKFQGCVATHFSGGWWDSGAQSYFNGPNGIAAAITAKPWKNIP